MMIQRKAFDRAIIDGFRTSKTESIAMTAHGRRMFVGTSDGMLLLYECRPDTVGTSSMYNGIVMMYILR